VIDFQGKLNKVRILHIALGGGNMKRAFVVVVLLFACRSFCGLDSSDSLVVRSMLEQIGWSNVSVDSVIGPVQTANSRNFRITQLDLSYRPGYPRLTSLPSQIGKLPELTFLSLSGNQISTLPEEAGTLYKLIHLDLSGNLFTDVSEEISRLQSLTMLDMSENLIKSFPEAVFKMGLKVLNLSRNQISVIPERIGEMSSLVNLYLNSNRVEEIPGEIAKLPNLEILQLDSNLLQDLPREITGLNLLKISLRGNTICFPDTQLSGWLDSHHLSLDWRASQYCPEASYSVIIREPNTGSTIMLYSNTDIEKSNLSQTQTLYVRDTLLSTAPAGKKVLKAVNVSINPLLSTAINVLTVSFPVEDINNLQTLSIYHVNSKGQFEFIESFSGAEGRVLSVKTTRTGIFALVSGEASPVKDRNLSRSSSFVKIFSKSSGITVQISLQSKSLVEVRVISLNGRLVSILDQRELSRGEHRLSFDRGRLPGKACILQVKTSAETVSRVIF
jgi:Leucine-rich repeat (LRR) protein